MKLKSQNINQTENFNCKDQIEFNFIIQKGQKAEIQGQRKHVQPNTQQQYLSHSQKILQRVNQPIPLFIVHVLIACIISFQNVFIIYGIGQGYQNGIKVIIAILFFISAFSILNSFYLVSFKEMVLMYTLIDGILAAQIAAQIGFVGSLIIVYTGEIYQLLLMIIIPVAFFLFVGNFRVCLRYAIWNSFQIIAYKISILAGAVCFFQIGVYFMASNFSYTNGQLQELDSKIKDFITLYAFGTFQFFLQLFGKICDFDQTSDLKYVYTFKRSPISSRQRQKSLVSDQDEIQQLNQKAINT